MAKKRDVRPLLQAIVDGKLSIVRQLIAKGLDPMQIAPGGWGPDHDMDVAAIHFAFSRKVPVSIGAYLLTLPDLDWNLAGGRGARPLHILISRCARPDTPARMQALVAKGADLGATDELGRTPLFELGFYYRSGGEIELFDALLDAGADPTHTDAEGRTYVDTLFEEMRLPSRESARVAALIKHALRCGARSRYRKDELALVDDPYILVDTDKVKRANAVAAHKSWLALVKAYRRVGYDEGVQVATQQVDDLASEVDLPRASGGRPAR